MDATLVLQHMDDGNFSVTTCDKDKEDTRRRAEEPWKTSHMLCMQSQQHETAVWKQQPGINNLSVSGKEEMSAGLIALRDATCFCSSERGLRWPYIIRRVRVCLIIIKCVCRHPWVHIRPAIHAATLYLEHWYFCSVTRKGKLYDQDLGIHRHEHPQDILE